jgi:branched-chain amino acid transport system substrate-binding protein
MVSAYAVHPDVVNAGDLIFSQSFPQKLQGAAAAYYATNELKAKKVAIISVDLDFGSAQVEGFKEELKKINSPIEIVYEQAIAISDNDMSSPVTAAAAAGADLIYSVNYYEQAAQVLREVGQKKLDIPVLGCEGADSFELLNIAGEYADGLYLTTNMNRDDENEQTQEYIKNYVEKYDIQPDMVGASVYDAFQVVFAALEECGEDTAAMQKYIAGLENFNTVTGELIRYNDDGSAVKPVQIQLVTDGEYHYAGVIDDPEIIDPANY